MNLLTLPEHVSSPWVFSWVRVTRYLVLYVCFVDCCLYFCTFSFGHRVSHSMKCQNMMGRPFVFERGGGLKYFDLELVDSCRK